MTTNANRQPSHRLFTVKGENDQTRWIDVGAAWPNKDQKGWTLHFDALPLDGRVVMREIAEKEGAQ